MAIDHAYLTGLPPIETHHVLTARDTMLYALSVGVAERTATDPAVLQFAYEQGLKALPTMAVVMAYPGLWARDPKYGLNWQKMLHGEHSVIIHQPLPAEGELVGLTRIEDIYDKGADKGALLYTSRKIYRKGSPEEPLATIRHGSFLRADGGFGGQSQGAPTPHPLPERPADLVLQAATRPDQALLYRLMGDYNPLHADPAAARATGFDRPILHGLATYGIAGRLLLETLCGWRPERFRRMDVRFSSPVYPGETLELEVWNEAGGQAAFRARAIERNVTVLQNGYLEFGS